jgi:hypothetical protein
MPTGLIATTLARLNWRFLAGVLCVVVAAGALVDTTPTAIQGFIAAEQDNSWRSPLQRLVHTGDVNGIQHDFQEAALAFVPPRSTFAVLPPPSFAIGQKAYGIAPVAVDVANDYFRFLLLPSRLVDASKAQYLLCFGCDTSPWDKQTTWLWKNQNGDGVGRVNRP